MNRSASHVQSLLGAAASEPPRAALARLPTPLQKLERTSAYLGVDFWIKRDDTTGAALSGNKVRKLEYLLADALASGCDTVVTGGGEQSNHCRATALAAATLGLRCRLLLRTEDKSAPPPLDGNSLLGGLAGAEIEWIDPADWARRGERFEETAAALRKSGRAPYIIPEGGSNALGAWGYLRCAAELADDLAPLPPLPTTVVYACGSGGTGAGLRLGLAALPAERSVALAGINVCDDEAYFVREISRICDQFRERFPGAIGADLGAVEIVDGHVGAGYAKSQDDELLEIRDMARREGILLDPVYSGKAFAGLVRELRSDRERFGKRIVFLHTGGVFGLFPSRARLAALL